MTGAEIDIILPLRTCFSFMPRWNLPDAKPDKGDPVPVFWVHVRLNFKHEAGDFWLLGCHIALNGRLRTRRRGKLGDALQQFPHAKIVDRAAEV